VVDRSSALQLPILGEPGIGDVAYQANTPVFWNAMDMIGGKVVIWLGGSFGDGKGQPSQSNSVSHGCVPARFKNVNIVNTGRGE
jgi:TldD protein